MGVPGTDMGQPNIRPQARTPTPLRRHHNAQVHRACPKPPQQARRPSHSRRHLRESGHLPPAYFNQLIEQYDGTRIGRQEIYAETIDEDEDALWKREWIEKARLSAYPPIARIVVAIDPAMSTKPNSSETGIVVVGADMRRKHAYVLADESGKLTPNSWALRAAHLFDKFNATRIVAEDNVGGDMVKSTLKNAVRAHPALQGHQGTTRQVHPRRTRRRPLRAGPRPPRRPLPPTRRPDVYLDSRPRPLQLPRPRRCPNPRHHRANHRPQPSQNLDIIPTTPSTKPPLP